MKFRILTDGREYKVEQRCFLSWEIMDYELNNPIGSRWVVANSFLSYKQAVQKIREKYGTRAEIVRPWIVAIN